MIQLRRILFPIAFSAAGASMAPLVREMAERFKATVTVLHAVNLAPEYISGPAPDTPCGSKEGVILFSPALQELRAQQEQRLNEFARAHFSGIRHTERIEDGEPAAVIEWVVKCENTDLIMMPTRGLGRFRRLLMGSVTSKILHDISCPVWTNVHEPEPAPVLPGGYRSILCAVGINPEEEDHVFNTASLFTRAYGARLCLLCIQSPSDKRDRQSIAQLIKLRFDQACTIAGRGMAQDTSVRILDGDIPEGIRQTARDEGADLLIVGRGHARENFSRARPLYTIIRESPCPVLSV
jgi:nucleotide-binding universal stress UspA family protein